MRSVTIDFGRRVKPFQETLQASLWKGLWVGCCLSADGYRAPTPLCIPMASVPQGPTHGDTPCTCPLWRQPQAPWPCRHPVPPRRQGARHGTQTAMQPPVCCVPSVPTKYPKCPACASATRYIYVREGRWRMSGGAAVDSTCATAVVVGGLHQPPGVCLSGRKEPLPSTWPTLTAPPLLDHCHAHTWLAG